MIAYIVRRFSYMLVLLAAVSVISFAIINLPPGDYLTTYIQNLRSSGFIVNLDEELALRKQYGLDQPATVQYLKWIGKFVRGDMGFSLQWQQRVSKLIGERIVLTMVVSIAAMLFSWGLGVPIGIYAGIRQYSFLDYVFTILGFAGMAIPSFLFALLLAYGMFRLTGMSGLGLFSPAYVNAPWSWAKVLDLLKHMVLPMVIIGTGGTAGLIRVMRGCLLDELGKAYVVTARAKGLKEWRMLMTYPVRIAINPVLSTIGWMLPELVSGSVLVSVVLNLPMVGPLLLRALLSQDMFLAASMVMILSALTIIGTFISDILLAWSDPRIRLAG